MKLSIFTHSSYGETGGINKYVSQVINCINNDEEVKKINIFAKLNAKKISKKTEVFISKDNYFFLILWNFKRIFCSDILLITHINLIPYLILFILFKKKIILFSYGLEIWGDRKNFIYRYLIKKINFFICMRNYTKKEIIKRYDLKNKFFYSLDNFTDDFKKYNKLRKRNIVLTIARLDSKEKFKGIDETLESISLIKKPNFKYVILGDGDDRSRLQKKTKKLGIENFVKFEGFVSEKKKIEYLKIAKVLSMPGSDKTFDTYPYRFSFLEAANYSLNILASRPIAKEKYNPINYKIFSFVDPKDRHQIKRCLLILLRKKNIFSKKLHIDLSRKEFCKKLLKHLDHVKKN